MTGNVFLPQVLPGAGRPRSLSEQSRGPVGDINVEVRAGGPFVGFQPTAATMYEDPNVFFGTLELDEAMRGWATGQPLVQVMSHFIRHPVGFMYDSEKYDFETVEDIRDSGVTVLVFEGSGYMDYYLGRGLLDPDQVDSSNNGAPDRWIAADGDIVDQWTQKLNPKPTQRA